MELNDFMTMKAALENGMSPYEQFKVGHMQSKHASGTAITGVVLGSVAAALGIGAWIFAPIYANSRAKAAQDVATAQNAGTAALLNQTAGLLATERAERVAGDINLTNTVNDSVSGSQQGTLTAQQAAELSAVQSVMNQTYSDFVTGRASLNPTPVSLYSSPQPCACPASGCGCNG